MLLSLDVGNTSVSFALFDLSHGGGSPLPEPVVLSRIAVRKNACADEYAVLIRDILRLRLGGADLVIDAAAVSSVVPSATGAISDAAYILSGKKPYMIAPGIKTGFRIGIYDPACLGADIVANAAAALAAVEPPLVIFDAGTANTVTVVDQTRTLVGTVISPGLRISSSALFENAELLDTVSLGSGKLPMIGRNTDESVRSGLIYGNALMLDGFIRNIRDSMRENGVTNKLALFATGEFARVITDHCRNKFKCDDALTVKGIAELFRKNSAE